MITTEDILHSLDLPAIESAILTDKNGQTTNILAHEFEDIKVMCWAAATKWLAVDLQTLSAQEMRLEEAFTITCGGYPVRGIMDLRSHYTSGRDSAGGDLRGRVLVADWKSSTGELDLVWQNRLIDSKQWRLYSLVPPGADFISFRGVNPKGKTREVYLNVATIPNIANDLDTYFGGVGDMMTALSERHFWPQNKPSACGAFGSECPHKKDGSCDPGAAPLFNLPAENIQLSYSGAQRFLLCPEKYRRSREVAVDIDDSTEASRVGVRFHLGMQEIYAQSIKLFGDK